MRDLTENQTENCSRRREEVECSAPSISAASRGRLQGVESTSNTPTVPNEAAETTRGKILRKCGESVEMKEKFFDLYAAEIEKMIRNP